MLRVKNELILNRGLTIPTNIEGVLNDNQSFLIDLRNQLINNEGIVYLPENSPFEIHPYKATIELQYIDKYIIGTFPPISYVYDLIPAIKQLHQPYNANGRTLAKPGFPFFHGNRKLMWDYLLTRNEYNNIPNNRNDIPNFLSGILLQTELNYADIIDSCQRQLEINRYKGSDNLLYNINFNKDLLSHLLSNNCSQYLLFNTASIYGNNGLEYDNNGLVSLDSDAKAFDLFLRAIQEIGYDIEMRINNGRNPMTYFPWTSIKNLNLDQRKNKIAFELKIINPIDSNIEFSQNFNGGDEKSFVVITPFSPAVAQRRNILAGNPIVNNWLASNNGSNTKDMLFDIYHAFRSGNWDFLFNLNA